MRCAGCKADNPEGLKFCNECGAALKRLCANCSFENASSAKFCGECGAALTEPSRAVDKPAEPERPNDGDDRTRASPSSERRHLTVLFCDLVGSTGISSKLDPEEWREALAGYHRAAAEAVTRFGGQVAKYLGDGVMAFFGYPEAHDNDAERAVRAALELLDAISKLNEQADSLPLKEGGTRRGLRPKLTARVGIDSGAVVV